MITKEQIEEKIKLLETERDQLRTNLIAYEGAIQANKQWLDTFDVQDSSK